MHRKEAIAWVVTVCAVSLRLSQAKTLGILVGAAMRVQRISLANIGRMMEGCVKHQIKRCWRMAFGKEPLVGPEQRSLARQYKGAFIGLGIGALILAWFSWRIGLTPWVAALFFGIYFLLAITLTRVRAELGTPHEIYFVNPRLILVTLFGSAAIGPQALTAMSAMYWFNRGYRCHPMPNQLEAMKLGETAKIKQSSILWMLVIAFAWGTLAAYWANLHVTFAEGASSKAVGFKQWVGNESYDRLGGWLQTPTRVNATQLLYVGIGFLLVLFMRLMRGKFLWWPFHPVGYVIAETGAMGWLWCPTFVGWLIKLVTLRYGGMGAYRRGIPLFIGLILGDYVVSSVWSVVGLWLHIPTYRAFPI